jgi:small-conductance mechanosensitive channel
MKFLCDVVVNEAVLCTLAVKALLIAGIVILGFVAIRFLSWLANRAFVSLHSGANARLIVGKIIWYAGLAIIIINIAHVVGIDLSVLLGAAGVAGVALGFASQTSMSNLISGLFLLSENFLTIGDEIICDNVEGTVESIDLFSVKVRTYDGKLVRIANERLIKENLVDVSYYPTRRVRIALCVPVQEGSLKKMMSIIDAVVRNNNQVKKERTICS